MGGAAWPQVLGPLLCTQSLTPAQKTFSVNKQVLIPAPTPRAPGSSQAASLFHYVDVVSTPQQV